MFRRNMLVRPLLAALMVVAILAPAAIADPNPPSKAPTFWSYDYQAPIPHPRADARGTTTDTDTPWASIAVILAGVTVLLATATVHPRRPSVSRPAEANHVPRQRLRDPRHPR